MAARIVFNEVGVSLPSKVRGSEAEEEWQEVDWVNWDTGDLSVDADAFLLVFYPSAGKAGPSTVKAKPLGSLLRAGAVGADEDSQRTLVVTTTDSLHRLYRFTFSSAKSVADFKELAADAEAAHAAASSLGTEGSGVTQSASQQQLIRAIQEKHLGRWPLIFGSAELYGPDPNATEQGSEVQLGVGAAVLLDPEETVRNIGEYNLLFFNEDEGVSKPLKICTIGPKMSLKRQPLDQDPDGPAAMFQLSAVRGLQVHSISFDEAATAAAFARDFRVRSRLMDVALKSASGERSAHEARDELRDLQRKSLGARLRNFMCLVIVLLLVSVVTRLGMLYSQDPHKAPELHLQRVKEDITHAAHHAHSYAKAAGSKVCEIAVGTVSTSALEKCLTVGGVSAVSECVAKLLPAPA